MVKVEPFVVTVSTPDVKIGQFNWNTISDKTLYRLYVNTDGYCGFTLQTDNMLGTLTMFILPVHFTAWVNATCFAEAYNATTKLVSATAISITI